jgi:hypothetical protein
MHRAVLELYLRLDPGDHGYLEPRGCLDPVVSQPGLADSVTATQQQHAAQASPDGVQQVIDRGSLGAPVKHGPLRTRPTAGRHGPRHPLPPKSHARTAVPGTQIRHRDDKPLGLHDPRAEARPAQPVLDPSAVGVVPEAAGQRDAVSRARDKPVATFAVIP